MADGLGAQNCPNGDCSARYAADVVDRRDDSSCPECGMGVAPCPVCQSLLLMTTVREDGECPGCRTDRRGFGKPYRERERAAGVIEA